jgi:hypothetical protein
MKRSLQEARERQRAASQTGEREDPFRYVDSAVGFAKCAICGRHEEGSTKHPQFFKPHGPGYVYHLSCLARTLGGYRFDMVRGFIRVADEGSGAF